MSRSSCFVILSLSAILTSAPHADAAGNESIREQLEAAGVDEAVPDRAPSLIGAGAMPSEALLIPDSTNDVVAMFSPFDGQYLGDLIDGSGTFSTPINALMGPDGNIYVSDQVQDAVFVFDTAGALLSVYADATDGLNNIRGIDFFGGNLFVTSGDDYIAEFAGPHNRLPDFIAIPGVDPFDVLFLDDGRALVTDIGTSDAVRLYNADGTADGFTVAAAFPEQVQVDPVAPGDFLEIEFTGDQIQDFQLGGAVVQTISLSTTGRGVFRLGNGNVLASGSFGVIELDATTGAVVTQIMTGSGWRFIEHVSFGPWTDLGFGKPGALGEPELSADGALTSGSVITVDLQNAAPNTTAHLIFGVSAINQPFFGGTLVPAPQIIVPLPTGPGSINFFAAFPNGVPAGIPVYLQYWIEDPTAVFGLSASNAITATTE